ncbi:2-oxo acid dehydrogenase subunit E2 [Paraflavitalea speifideaquila]|uniref:2-oxo acid dehydrogenase subunit E2 n=1 Tax=Paraflavitalea speifideaquila TaxID=3076558 RepID=UPI0028E76CE8|nr:2-oxo acid dehydrogenase subunit E2 [Paraflavitalea speifideiaquila]
MAVVDLVMPKLGESIMEATVLKWHKQPGDTVKMDETVLEIATDKVDSEVPSTAEGVIEDILFHVNDVVPIGTIIARIRTGAAEPAIPVQKTPPPAASNQASTASHQQPVTTYQPSTTTSQQTTAVNGSANRFYSPLVLNIAAGEGVSMTELENIPGTGNEGRVTKKDILQYVEARKTGKAPVLEQRTTGFEQKSASQAQVLPAQEQKPLPAQSSQLPAVPSYSGNIEIIEMDRMRKAIANHMVSSKDISAHVTSFTEADVTNMVLWRDRVKKEFEKREGEKLTFTPLFIEAVVRCIKKYPWLNSSVDGDKIIIKKISISVWPLPCQAVTLSFP